MDESILRNLYIELNLSQREIAERLKCSQTNVRYYITKFDIKKNKQNKDFLGIDRECTHCHIFQSKENFYIGKRKGQSRMGSWCKKCMNDQVVIRQRNYKLKAISYKGGSCQYCGFNEYAGALEFHHLDPTQKDIELSKFSRQPLSKEGKAELDKCVLLCSNHHRMIHAGLISL